MSKITFKVLTFTLCALTGVVATLQGAEPIRLRVLSYNIQIGRAPGGSYDDPSAAFLDKTASRIASTNPDVAGLQEVDNRTNRSGANVDQLAELARLTQLNGSFVGKTELPGGVYGIGVLSKEKPIETRKVLIKGSSHTRVLEICEFENYVFFNSHFPLKDELRVAAAKIVEEEAQKYNKPILFVGDLNATPDSEEIKYLKERWTQISPDAPTFPSTSPNEQIDYIFIRNVKNLRGIEAKVAEDSQTSDHRPVFCEVEFEAR